MPVPFPVSYICLGDIYDQIASHRTCWDLRSRYKAIETHTKTGTLDLLLLLRVIEILGRVFMLVKSCIVICTSSPNNLGGRLGKSSEPVWC